MESNNQHIETESIKEIIYYTLNDYKDNYNKTHELFIDKYNDATELDFIQNQILNYKIYIENATFIEWEYEPSIVIEAEIKGENIVSEIIDKVKSKTKEIDYEKCRNFAYSFNAIITYLENNKKEIQGNKTQSTNESIKTKQIPDLYGNINFNTLPNSIYTKISQYGNEKCINSYTNKEGKRITEYGEKMPPMFMKCVYDKFNFRMLIQWRERFNKKIKSNEIRNVNGTVLNNKTIIPYWLEYSKGFHKGHSNYESRIKGSDNVFSLSDESIADKIYSDLFKLGRNKGQIGTVWTGTTPHEHITKELMYNAGLNSGEFYKGLEIVLNNPLVFEPVFDKYSKEKVSIQNNSIDWKGTTTELTALIKSLIESKKLDNSLSEKEIVKRFELFLNTEVKTYNQTKTKIRKRTKDYTPFIDKLKTNLEHWILKKD